MKNLIIPFLALSLISCQSTLSKSNPTDSSNEYSDFKQSYQSVPVNDCPFDAKATMSNIESAANLLELGYRIEQARRIYNHPQCSSEKSVLRNVLISSESQKEHLVYQQKYLLCAANHSGDSISSCQDNAQKSYDSRIQEITQRY